MKHSDLTDSVRCQIFDSSSYIRTDQQKTNPMVRVAEQKFIFFSLFLRWLPVNEDMPWVPAGLCSVPFRHPTAHKASTGRQGASRHSDTFPLSSADEQPLLHPTPTFPAHKNPPRTTKTWVLQESGAKFTHGEWKGAWRGQATALLLYSRRRLSLRAGRGVCCREDNKDTYGKVETVFLKQCIGDLPIWTFSLAPHGWMLTSCAVELGSALG